MGLFDDLFGSKKKTDTTSVSSGNSTQNQTNTATQTGTSQQTSTNTGTTTATGTQTGTTSQQGSQVQTTQNLDADTINLLKTLLPNLSTNAANADPTQNSDALKQVAAVAFGNGTGGNDSAVNAAISADQAKAKLDFQTGEGQQIAGVQQGIGSKNNTYSQLIEQKGQSDLATQLDQITANAKLNELGLNNSSLNTAIAALTQSSQAGSTDANTAINPILAIVQALKGASTTTAGQTQQTGQTQETSTQQTIQDLINAITGSQSQTETGTASAIGTTNQTSNTKGSESSHDGIVQTLVNLF